MSSSPLPGFRRAGPDLAPPFVALSALPLTVLVGVTGVGKSTTLAALRELGVHWSALPNRREVTDAVMIEPFAGGPVHDREERFRLTARYRQAQPGGMAEALSKLALDPACWPGPLLFDGLRGRSEVEYAAAHFPKARLIALHAPDLTRVRRLLGRGDAFDAVSRVQPAATSLEERLRALPGALEVFGETGIRELAALPHQGQGEDEVLAKTKIVLAERVHYDPEAAGAFLATLPPERALVLDTLALPPHEVARRIVEWL